MASNDFVSLDLSGCPELTSVSVRNCKSLASLDLSVNTKLASIRTDGSGLTSLELGAMPDLWTLNCYGMHLTELDITATGLGTDGSYELYCGNQTDADGADMTLTLIMTAAQNEYWKSSLEGKRNNGNIEVIVK